MTSFSLIVLPAHMVILAVYVLFGIDPLYMATNDIIQKLGIIKLPDSSILSVLCMLIRIVVVLPTIEIVRSITGALWYAFVFLDLLNSCIKTVSHRLRNRVTSEEESRRLCIQISVIFRMTYNVLEAAMSVFYSFAFWFIILGTYILIKGYGTVPVYIHWMVSCLFLPTVAFVFMSQTLISHCTDTSKSLVSSLKICTLRRYKLESLAGWKSSALVLKKASDALKPVVVTYRPTLTPIDTAFVKEWFKNCVERLMDAVILF